MNPTDSAKIQFFSGFTLLVLIILSLNCKADPKQQKDTPKAKEIVFEVFEMTATDSSALDAPDCPSLPVSFFKKLKVSNAKYDTLWLPVTDFCKPDNRRLLFDRVDYYLNNKLESSDMINTASGYEYPLLEGDSITLFLRLKSVVYNQNISFDAKINEYGTYKWEKLRFNVVFPNLK